MCVARLVMQQWRDDFEKLLTKSNIKEKLSRIYVDDNRCIIERIMRGKRFSPEEGLFMYKDEWEIEDREREKMTLGLQKSC